MQFSLIDEPYFEHDSKGPADQRDFKRPRQDLAQIDFWRIDWIPDTDHGLLWAAQKIKSGDPNGDYAADQAENILITIYNILDKLESAGPLLDDAMRILYAGIALTYGEVKASGPLRNMLPVDRRAPLEVAMAEWSFNPADLTNLLDRCKEYYRQHGWPNLPIEIELTKTDNYYMSPWNWPGLDYIIKFNFMYLTNVSQTPAERQEIIDHLQGLWNHLQKSGYRSRRTWEKSTSWTAST